MEACQSKSTPEIRQGLFRDRSAARIPALHCGDGWAPIIYEGNTRTPATGLCSHALGAVGMTVRLDSSNGADYRG